VLLGGIAGNLGVTRNAPKLGCRKACADWNNGSILGSGPRKEQQGCQFLDSGSLILTLS
jgi:hypothetical protein